MPKVSGTWAYDAGSKQIRLELRQTQTGDPYRLPIEIGIAAGTAPPRVHKIELTAASGTFSIPADAEPTAVTIDPNSWVLLESAELTKR
jgi:hypothetical protein